MTDRFAQASAALAARQRERRGTGPVSGRTERRDRQRMQALALHPGLVAHEEPGPRNLQVPTPGTVDPGEDFTSWMNAPSTGGASGRPFVSMARYSARHQILEVIFANTSKRWEYSGVDEEAWHQYRSGERSWPMLFDQRRFGPGQPSRQFEKL